MTELEGTSRPPVQNSPILQLSNLRPQEKDGLSKVILEGGVWPPSVPPFPEADIPGASGLSFQDMLGGRKDWIGRGVVKSDKQ